MSLVLFQAVMTAALLGVSLAQLVRTGAIVYAKREFLNHKKHLSPAASEGNSAEPALLRSGSGVAGVADTRIQAAFDALTEAKSPITPAKLATKALTGYPTAVRWLKIHHPELLSASKPPPSQPPPEAPKPETPVERKRPEARQAQESRQDRRQSQTLAKKAP